MRAVVTRVRSASVEVAGRVTASIGKGFLVLLGVHEDDSEADAEKISDRICGLRVFTDEQDKMNLNLSTIGGEILIVSQFTLFADCKKSRRPSFNKAAKPAVAVPLYEKVVNLCRERGFPVQTGSFGEHMLVQSVNDGPVTILLDSTEL
jgi:D-tyrosyl-tRNA(Tyr) deacylase